MQLFSIGLLTLNDDGTPVLDPASGLPLETYTVSERLCIRFAFSTTRRGFNFTVDIALLLPIE